MPDFKEKLKKLWSGWMWFAAKLGHFNSLVLLTVVFIVVVGPANLLARLFRADLLKLRKPASKDPEAAAESYWLPVHSDNTTVDAWRRQF